MVLSAARLGGNDDIEAAIESGKLGPPLRVPPPELSPNPKADPVQPEGSPLG